jgi:hypothetical protein
MPATMVTRAFSCLVAGLAVMISAVNAAPNASAASIAFVTDLKGEHRIDGKRAVLMAEVGEGQSVSVGADGTLVLMFIQSGHEYALSPGEYKVAAGTVQPTPGKGAQAGKATRRATPWRPDPGSMVNVSRTATASLRMRGLPPVAQTNSTKPRAIEPVDTAVTSIRPKLVFQAPPGKVKVRIEADGKLVQQVETESREWIVTERLVPGQRYRWVVASGGEEGGAGFTVVDDAALKRLAGLPSPRTFSDRLLRAVTLQSVGATGEARAAFSALAAERPDLPELANLGR